MENSVVVLVNFQLWPVIFYALMFCSISRGGKWNVNVASICERIVVKNCFIKKSGTEVTERQKANIRNFPDIFYHASEICDKQKKILISVADIWKTPYIRLLWIFEFPTSMSPKTVFHKYTSTNRRKIDSKFISHLPPLTLTPLNHSPC